MTQALVRTDRTNRVIGGVCGGLARRYGWNAKVVRLAFVASCLLPGPQLLIYILLWIVMPSERRY
ncbi:PspC domain-containing protein [Mobilicoccus massiliensis]|uniref:PspC domain-containing protein n=1 Tax=Mobilicoccus massiliensis TaxID=1522310 RepID=UPI0005914998|nr:PspC domain-containing protein [Mobilicoccus massiliensis]